MKILTQQTRVPWSWVVIALLPWTAVTITQFVNVLGLTFTLKKFTDDPVVISLITGSQQGFALIIGALVAFASDRIWTRWGRGKPILLTGWIFSGIFILLVPFAPNLSTVKFSAGAVYGLPAGIYNYMAAFHWLFLVGVLGIAYLFVFERRFARRLFAAKAERERLRPRRDIGV